MSRLSILACVTAVSFLLSGCVVGQSEGDVRGTDAASAPTFDDASGAIAGFVTDEEGVPLPGANVGLIEAPEKATVTDADGAFSISNVAPGTYTVAATALGYETTAFKVEVLAGQVTDKQFALRPLEVLAGYHLTQIKDGSLACSFRAYPGFPLTGVVASGWYTGVAVCGLPGVNTTTGDKFLVGWDSGKGVHEVTLEMSWSTNQALGRGLSVNLEDPSGINNGRPIYGGDTGPSPLRVDANETRVMEVTEAGSRDCRSSRCSFTTRVFAEANTTELYLPTDPPSVGPFGKPRNKVDVGVVVNQRFTQYLTTFHNAGMPEGFTALADQ